MDHSIGGVLRRFGSNSLSLGVVLAEDTDVGGDEDTGGAVDGHHGVEV